MQHIRTGIVAARQNILRLAGAGFEKLQRRTAIERLWRGSAVFVVAK
jgi:hypothetical protein